MFNSGCVGDTPMRADGPIPPLNELYGTPGTTMAAPSRAGTGAAQVEAHRAVLRGFSVPATSMTMERPQ
eukprot:5425173-Pyramimonas_sp.AAC.1